VTIFLEELYGCSPEAIVYGRNREINLSAQTLMVLMVYFKVALCLFPLMETLQLWAGQSLATPVTKQHGRHGCIPEAAEYGRNRVVGSLARMLWGSHLKVLLFLFPLTVILQSLGDPVTIFLAELYGCLPEAIAYGHN